ncbi:head completion/stabilization protein [Escherichia coli]|uniref:head completion/stabilization protein n=1 Tax=Escherichia coli TaxID=562 RepID=UPI0028785CBB|nr:head completion/stabilization protein [Escherichia coli]MDS1619836.1 head completion/stabilization protein [Escherichia coli]
MGTLTAVSHSSSEDLVNSEFWPFISLSDLRDSIRLTDNLPLPRLRHMACEAMARVNDELRGWKALQTAAGYPSLDQVPSDYIAGESVLVQRYRRAVYAATRALIVESYRDIDTTREGEKHAEALATQIDALWRDSQWALRDIQGLPRGLAEIV